jgi:hypothetical protein
MRGLNVEHQGRELLHGIELLNRCLLVGIGTTAVRRQWGKDLRRARSDLAALYLSGLDRDFRTAPKK